MNKERIKNNGSNGHENGTKNYLAHLGGVIWERRPYVPRREAGMTQFQVDTRIHGLRVGLRTGCISPPSYYQEVWPLRRLRKKFNKPQVRMAERSF